MKISGEVAMVTGAGSGLGAVVSRSLASAGAKLAVVDLNYETADALARDLNKEGGECMAYGCDVGLPESGLAAVRSAKKDLGVPRLLVNAAGIAPAKRIVSKDGPQSLEEFEVAVRVNLLGSFNMMRLVAAEMLNAKPLKPDDERGVIINTGSIAAFEGQLGQASYAASKAGVVGLTLPAARELAQFGIRVNCINPGIMDTPMLQNMAKEVRDNLIQQVPFPRRLGQPEEYTKLCLHICDNVYLNGAVFRLDGAMRMH